VITKDRVTPPGEPPLRVSIHCERSPLALSEAQIPVETGGRVDLVNDQRYEVCAQFALNF
jgi:hypothetical protein